MKTGTRTLVVKVGGAHLERPEYVSTLADHVHSLGESGDRVVVVHGGGREISNLHEHLDEPWEKRDGIRVTSPRGMEITTMVLCGLINKRLVAASLRRGTSAIGLSGVDLSILRASLADGPRLGRVGRDVIVNAAPLREQLLAGRMVFLSPVALGDDGHEINVNADTAAQAVARALGAERLDFVSDVPGVLRSKDALECIPRLTAAEASQLLLEPSVVVGGMRPKLTSAIEAVRAGVPCVRVGNLSTMRQDRATEVVS
jgi:acetylglutamate kinase